MKTISIITSLLALGVLVTQAEPAATQRSTAQVTLRATDKTVRPEREKKNDDGKKDKKPKSESVTKTIEVDISAAKSINGPLKIVTQWYARDVGARKQVKADKHESEVALDESKTAKATVPPFTFTHTPAHSTKEGKIPASGQDYAGWVIRAYEGTTLVGETASSPRLLKLQEKD